MDVLDNITKTLKSDLEATISKNSKLSVIAACFSIYAYEALKKQLNGIKELKFIFTSPTFVSEKEQKERREFYIPRLNRERSLYGSEFEIKLRNELTQKAIARECAEWIRQKASFRSNVTNENMTGFLNVSTKHGAISYMPINGFTTVDLGQERGNNAYSIITKLESPDNGKLLRVFEEIWNDKSKLQDVTDEIIATISAVYRENSPELIYFIAIYNIFKDFLNENADNIPNEATGFKNSLIWNKLYDFQKDAALAIINKLERYNGCILADSVGLGKTFTAMAVIKYYENRNKNVLVLCPKKLSENWMTYKANYINNPLAGDRLRYDVLYHTDLSRTSGSSNGLELDRLNWGNYDLVVIDESHNFRNGGQPDTRMTIAPDGSIQEPAERENRYTRLLNKVIREGVRTKVLMLSATPVNNRFTDLRNQLALAYEGDSSQWSDKLKSGRSVEEIFRMAQKAFNRWTAQPLEKRTTKGLLEALDLDFFELLDSVTIARSRRHIETYYNMEELGRFPSRLRPISLRPMLTSLPDITYAQIFGQLASLNLEVYSPSAYIFPSRQSKYIDSRNLTQAGREQGIRRLMGINLLKRLESSVYSFKATLERVYELIENTLVEVVTYAAGRTAKSVLSINNDGDFDDDDQNIDHLMSGGKIEVNLADIDYQTWIRQMRADQKIISGLLQEVGRISDNTDSKLQALFKLIDDKQKAPINAGNRKLLIFTAFSDTAEYLYEKVSRYCLDKYGLNSALVTGTGKNRTTIPGFPADMNAVLTCFSPVSKERELLMPGAGHDIDILISTDCLSEGQNLQDCDYVVNYDIHWNPVRIIQRFGRIDRIGSLNEKIQLASFWPDISLDEYINLKSRVETRMKISVLTASGGGDPLSEEEKGDLEYRRRQLEQLQNEVVNIEDISGGLSIMDLGLNEFRLDLVEFIKSHGGLDSVPFGINAAVPATPGAPPGVIFVLRNINDEVNLEGKNRIHPFYMIYMDMNGEVVCNHLAPKKLLEDFRQLCKGRSEPDPALCRELNRETKDGHDMSAYSSLLGRAIASMMEAKEESDIDSLFRAGGTSALLNPVRGLDDYELICFLIVR